MVPHRLQYKIELFFRLHFWIPNRTHPFYRMHDLVSTIATLQVFSSYKHILGLLLPYITRFHLNLHKATHVIRCLTFA